MAARDRTAEFASAISSMQSRQVNGFVPAKRQNGANHHSQFMLIAKNIGKDLANTFAKLEKLGVLARKKSLFDDRPEEIQQLTLIIKQDICSLNKQIAQLQQLSKSLSNLNSHQKQTQTGSVVVTLQSHLASMSNKFKSVLEVRTENMKQQKSRREQFSEPTNNFSTLNNDHSCSILLQDEDRISNGGMNGTSTHLDRLDKQRYQNQLQLINDQDAFIQSRANTMMNIEQTIVELGTIFQQLAHMVKEQDEVILRIDTNIDDTQLNVEAAHGEIVKYFQTVTSNRWLMIKIFGVLIVFFIIFVVFLA
jgi:syntaxin 5